jgi:two-component sensor histidine kinase
MMRKEFNQTISQVLNTPFRIGSLSLILSEFITISIVFLSDNRELLLFSALIAGFCGFFIAYGTSFFALKWLHEIEEKNQQLEAYQSELQEAKDQLEARVVMRTQELIDANQHIQNSLDEKEVLLKEIHHRVKNNLQIISSLLNLQSQYIQDEEAVALFSESQRRVLSMAFVHEKLYSSGDLVNIDFADYVDTLIEELNNLYLSLSDKIAYQVKIDSTMTLDIDSAIPCGLIVNELVSNAYKHAFNMHDNGLITVNMTRESPGQLWLEVSDNGRGFPADFDPHSFSNLGLQIVDTLVHQIGGEVEYRSENGAKVSIRFAV